jgi:hypothetical protein
MAHGHESHGETSHRSGGKKGKVEEWVEGATDLMMENGGGAFYDGLTQTIEDIFTGGSSGGHGGGGHGGGGHH